MKNKVLIKTIQPATQTHPRRKYVLFLRVKSRISRILRPQKKKRKAKNPILQQKPNPMRIMLPRTKANKRRTQILQLLEHKRKLKEGAYRRKNILRKKTPGRLRRIAKKLRQKQRIKNPVTRKIFFKQSPSLLLTFLTKQKKSVKTQKKNTVSDKRTKSQGMSKIRKKKTLTFQIKSKLKAKTHTYVHKKHMKQSPQKPQRPNRKKYKQPKIHHAKKQKTLTTRQKARLRILKRKHKDVFETRKQLTKTLTQKIRQSAIRFSFLERRIVIEFILNVRLCYAERNKWGIPTWINDWLILTHNNFGIYNIYQLIRAMRLLLYSMYLHSFYRNLFIIHGTLIQENFLRFVGYCFGKKYKNGFISNFRSTIRMEYLLAVQNSKKTRFTRVKQSTKPHQKFSMKKKRATLAVCDVAYKKFHKLLKKAKNSMEKARLASVQAMHKKDRVFLRRFEAKIQQSVAHANVPIGKQKKDKAFRQGNKFFLGRVPCVPTIAVELGRLNHHFVRESSKMGLRINAIPDKSFDIRPYNVEVFCMGYSYVGQYSFSGFSRETAIVAALAERLSFKRRVLIPILPSRAKDKNENENK